MEPAGFEPAFTALGVGALGAAALALGMFPDGSYAALVPGVSAPDCKEEAGP